MEQLAFWVPIIISVVSSIIAVSTLLRQIRRDKPDIAETYENMATRQAERITKLQVTVDEMECEIKELKSIISEWTKGITILTTQIETAGCEPDWRPKNLTKG